jgi:tetratricopeptide (TPR) repeat protein
MSVAEYIALFSTVAGAIVALIVGLPRFLEWREQQHQRERTAERKLREARDMLKKARNERQARWTWGGPLSLDEPRPEDLEEKARSYLLDALEVGPSRQIQVEIHLELGKLAHQRSEPAAAEEELAAALRLNRRAARAYEERGLLRWWRGDKTRALEDMERAHRLLPPNERQEIERRLHSWRDQITENEKRRRND